MAVCRLLLSIKFNREVTPQKNCRQRRQTSNVRLPLELRSDRRETSATRVSDDLQLSIFRRRGKKKSAKISDRKTKKTIQIFFRRQKIEICKSSESRVAEFSPRLERSSRGKRTFEVRRRLGGIREAYTIRGGFQPRTRVRQDHLR